MKEVDSNTLFLLLLVFLFVDLFFVALRAAFVHTHLTQLVNLREKNPASVERTLNLLERRYLPVTLRVWVVIIHFIVAGLVWLLAIQLVLPISMPYIFLLVLIFGGLFQLVLEYSLEGVVLHRPEQWAVSLTPVCEVLDSLLRPVTWLLMAVMGSPDNLQRNMVTVTDDELKTWVEEGQTEGTLEKGERKMIASIFDFSDTLCREIMVPRIDVFALDVNTSLQEAVREIIQSGHSRVLVYEENIDNIIGMLYSKDMLRLNMDGEKPASIRELLRSPYFVPEAKKVDELLSEMRERRVHMVVVVDEYGGMAGLVTLEDIVEEIVGEIRDEYDSSEENLYQQVSPDEFHFLGKIDLDDVNDVLGTHLTRDVADTLGGFIYGQIGRIPTGGERIQVEDWDLVVEQVTGRRIRRVHAIRHHEIKMEEKVNEIE